MSTTISNNTDSLYEDMYPRAGDRIKQWVVDVRREAQWESATCPLVAIAEHRDNTDALCRNVPSATWIALQLHDCCSTCNDAAGHEHMTRDDVRDWLIAKSKRQPIEQDRSKLSDEITPDELLTEHPILGLLRSKV